jgi:dienelactone hydrolase
MGLSCEADQKVMATLRDNILACLGEFPARVATDWTAEDTFVREGVQYSRVQYTVAPGERVAAWLLRPVDATGALPGILAIHQHAGEFYLGKAETAGLAGDSNQHYGLELARRGYLVLCPDHLAFEDRRPPEYERLARPSSLQDRNHELWLGKVFLVQGTTLQAKYLSDLAHALDVLAAQPGVDANALGCIGHSLGGQEALWLAWYDDRIRATVSSCGVSLLSTVIRDRIDHNMAVWVPGLLKIGDMDTVVAGIAPRACLMIQGESDPIFPLDGVHHIARRVGLAYADHGQPDRFALTTFPGGHGFPIEMRKAAYHWLDRWLKPAKRTRRSPEPLW